MKIHHYFKIALLLIIISACSHPQIKTNINLIPKPDKIERGDSYFVVNDGFKITTNSETELKKSISYFTELCANSFGIKMNNENKQSLNLVLDSSFNQNKEAYSLKINSKDIEIKASDDKGIFYGLQTLYQLMLENNTEEGVFLPELKIADSPRFSYRGMHLDVGRHLFPVEFIKKYIDLLAFYKFNTFHWHLTEDQGWRIEIKKYPKLTEVGAWRNETLIGHGGKKPYKYDGKKYGGFYTQEEIKQIVKYAAERKITIIPEIEMPGHSMAALAAYPQLACKPQDFKVAKRWGVFPDIYCIKDETFEFLENVLLEVMDLFPSKYIHIGGDEAPKIRWKECSVCQATIKREGLKNEHELQSYFIQRIEKFLNSQGREIIGWDEILEGGLAPNATVMSWRGTQGGIAAANMGHNAIMTPGSHCYFDHFQANPETEPLAIGGYTTLEKVYSYEPVPDTLDENAKKHILGAQANVWTEYMETPEYVEYMVLPRMAALAEVNWIKPDKKNWAEFKNNIIQHFKIYDELGYNYCDHPFEKK